MTSFDNHQRTKPFKAILSHLKPKLTQSAPTLVSNSPKSNPNVAHLSLPQGEAPVAKPSRLRVIPTPNVAQASPLESNSNPDDSRDSTKKRNEAKLRYLDYGPKKQNEPNYVIFNRKTNPKSKRSEYLS
jgi:hypothetical protein